MKIQGRLMQARFIEIHQDFEKKNGRELSERPLVYFNKR